MKKIFILSCLCVLVFTGCNTKNQTVTLTIEEAKTKASEFFQNNLIQPGTDVSIKEVTEEAGMYKVIFNVPTQGGTQELNSYITKDGLYFFPQGFDIAQTEQEIAEKKAAQEATQNQTVPKNDKPLVELFVMSFCPYGVTAEAAMSPVIDLLGNDADINIRFIANITGDDINQVSSLHGPIEGIEDARQLCVAKNYDKTILWSYVNEINEKCYPIYRNGDDIYQDCWQTAAQNNGIDINKIDTCVESEGPDLIREENTLTTKYGVSGSPTLIINGVKYTGARTSEAFKTAICNAFNNAPESCSEELSTSSTAPDGGC